MGMHGHAWEARESMIDAWGCMGAWEARESMIDAWGCMGRRWDQKM